MSDTTRIRFHSQIDEDGLTLKYPRSDGCFREGRMSLLVKGYWTSALIHMAVRLPRRVWAGVE